MRFLIIFLLVSACARTMTPSEQNFMFPLMGDELNVEKVRMLEVGFIGVQTRTYEARPQVTCRERIAPPPSASTIKARTAGAVAWTYLLTNPDWTLPDYAAGYPDQINLVAAMYFAHEMTHIWQWQNRDLTGYSPMRGLAEHKPGVDPYLFDPSQDVVFLSMGYEQQAALVEEFVCCRTLAPEAPRTERLFQVLSSVMPVQHPSQTPRPSRVSGVHEGTNLTGICD